MKINYEEKYKKLSKDLKKFLDKYNWGQIECLKEDNGISSGYFSDEDEPDHFKEVTKLYKLL